jgi:predicted  nucleic acid-binding Zn-ribbon protein
MRGLPLLVRLAQQGADERQGDLSQIARASADASAPLDQHDASAAEEANRALSDPAALAALVSWTPHAARGRATLQQRAAELDRSELAAREALRDAIARTRRLELALEAIQVANRRTAMRRADQQADERELVRQRVTTPAD